MTGAIVVPYSSHAVRFVEQFDSLFAGCEAEQAGGADAGSSRALLKDCDLVDWMVSTCSSTRAGVAKDLSEMCYSRAAEFVARDVVTVASAQSDGTARANGALMTAVADARAGSIIVLGPGFYDGRCIIDSAMDIIGHPRFPRDAVRVSSQKNCFIVRPKDCASAVRCEGPGAAKATGARVTLMNISFETTEADYNGLICSAGRLDVIDCVCSSRGLGALAVRGAGAYLVVTDTVIRNCVKGAVVAIDGAECRVERCVLSECGLQGLEARNHAHMAVYDSVVMRCRQNGALVQTGGRLTLHRTSFVGNGMHGVMVSAGGALVDAAGCVFSRNRRAIYHQWRAADTDDEWMGGAADAATAAFIDRVRRWGEENEFTHNGEGVVTASVNNPPPLVPLQEWSASTHGAPAPQSARGPPPAMPRLVQMAA